MLRTAQRPNNARQKVSQSMSLPAPVGGWNARDSIANMEPIDAVFLINLIPRTDKVELRSGYTEWATGLGSASAPVETLMCYAGGATVKLFGASNGTVFDCTTSGAATTALSSMSNDRWSSVNFGTPAGLFKVAVNEGTDDPHKFDGTTWAVTTITGTSLTASNLVYITEHKERLWAVEKDTLNVHYGPLNSIAGTFVKQDYSSLCKKGGFMQAVASWTRDGGDGIDDLFVAITNQGQVIVYQGTDPTNAATWALVGVFEVGSPIGRRCFENLGGELIVNTQDGVIPISQLLPTARSQPRLNLSDKISGAVNTVTRTKKDNFGWQLVFYPKGNMFLVNVPIGENSEAEQYVLSLNAQGGGAWCQFKGMNANCWAVCNDNLFFGGNDGRVFKADNGESDDGSNITGDGKPAFNYLGTPGRNKRFLMARTILESDGTVNAQMDAQVDFEDTLPTGSPTFSGTAGSEWDVSLWDVSDWAAGTTIIKDWQNVNKVGFAGTVRLQVVSNSVKIFWHAWSLIYEPGDPV